MLYHKYYQYYGSIGSGLNGFVTKVGDWRYLDEELSSFSIGWDDSVDRYYDIIESDTEKLVIQKNDSGPAGRGLGDINVLLSTADHVTYEVPEVLLPLMGTWYYDEEKDGKSLSFRENNTCTYRYYQNYGGSLKGWVNKSGSWSYISEDNILRITMPGEITYPYLFDMPTLGELYLELPENRPAGTSMIYSGTCFYK
jgi:glucan-binding YG repeat protein